MFGFISRWRERRRQKRQLKELQAFASGFNTLDRLEQSGLLAWDQKQRRLFIDKSLAVVMMRNVESWTNFINNVFKWLYSRQVQKAWNDYFLREELKAVREATKKYASMTRADIERIREARRMEILESDMEAPKIQGFEFFIIAPPELSEAKDPSILNSQLSISNEPVGCLTAVGHYDPDTEKMEMALWSEVERLVQEH